MHPLNSPIMSEFMRYLLSHTKFEWNEETGNLVEVEKNWRGKKNTLSSLSAPYAWFC